MSAIEEMAANILKRVLGNDGVEKVFSFISGAADQLTAMKAQQDEIAADVRLIKSCVVKTDPAEAIMHANIHDMYERGEAPLALIEKELNDGDRFE